MNPIVSRVSPGWSPAPSWPGRRRLGAALSFASGLVGSTVLAQAPAVPPPAVPAAAGQHLVDGLPQPFVPNLGQWQHGASYVARFGPMTVYVASDDAGWTFSLVEPAAATGAPPGHSTDGEPRAEPRRSTAVRMHFAGANVPAVHAEQPLPGTHNYFLGADRARWRTGVPLYGAVRMAELYPGVAARLHADHGCFEYDVCLQPGAALDQVVVEVEGADRLTLRDDGALVMETVLGAVCQPRPRTWQRDASGRESELACDYVVLGPHRFGFAAKAWDGTTELVVDPGLVWSTYLGGSLDDNATAVAIDLFGDVTVVGSTRSSDFPTTVGAFSTTAAGGGDVFVTRLSAGGSSLLWSTYLGGIALDEAAAVGLSVGGEVTVAGKTFSSNFPTTPGAYSTTKQLGIAADAFVTRLSATGSTLMWSTYLGGNQTDQPFALAIDTADDITIVGQTLSSNFPTTAGAFDTTLGGSTDTFVCRLSSAGNSLLWSTYLGGNGTGFFGGEVATNVAVDLYGDAVVVGSTGSSDFPTTANVYDSTYNGGFSDAFVTRFYSTGALAWSTFLGGSVSESAWTVGLDLGMVAVAGSTSSANFPTTTGAYDTTHNVADDGFVAQLLGTGSSLIWSTFLGGSANDRIFSIALDADDNVFVTGDTASANLPTTPGAHDGTFNGGAWDVLVAELSASGSQLLWSSYFGGSLDDNCAALKLGSAGEVTIAGKTTSLDLPTSAGAFATARSGSSTNFDATVARLRIVPTGIRRYGDPTPGCQGAPTIHALDDAIAGSNTFGLACTAAPANAAGSLLVGIVDLPAGYGILGATLWLQPFFAINFVSGPTGELSYVLPLNPATQGGRFFAQFAWYDPNCGSPLSSSDALEVTVQ